MGLELGFGIGTVILLGALAYGVTQSGRRSDAEKRRTDEATRDLYASTKE